MLTGHRSPFPHNFSVSRQAKIPAPGETAARQSTNQWTVLGANKAASSLRTEFDRDGISRLNLRSQSSFLVVPRQGTPRF